MIKTKYQLLQETFELATEGLKTLPEQDVYQEHLGLDKMSQSALNRARKIKVNVIYTIPMCDMLVDYATA